MPTEPFIIIGVHDCELSLCQQCEFCLLVHFESGQKSWTSISSEPHSGHLTAAYLRHPYGVGLFEPSGLAAVSLLGAHRQKVHLHVRQVA
jgi:hypothetical protein